MSHRSSILASLVLVAAFSATAASAWTGPTAAPPNNNVNAPINVGSTDQVKNANIGVNGLAVFGNTLLQGNAYLNWGSTSGTNGYGIWDNAGTLYFKNSGGTGGTNGWKSLQTIISEFTPASQWAISGSHIYNSNSGNVGIGTVPNHKLHVVGPASTGVNAIYAITGINDSATYGVMGAAGSYYGGLGRGDGYSFVGNGTLYNNGTANATSFLYLSDRRMKENVRPLDLGISSLMKLAPVSFTWKDSAPLAGQHDIGLIAQDVEKVIPGVVQRDNKGTLSIDYVRLTPVLLKALQEQEGKIEAQQIRIERLEAEIAQIKSGL